MRLIDAHALLTAYEGAMKELVQATNAENISLETLSLLCGAKLIAEAPTIGGWISVKDAMPKTGNVYLITLNPPATIPHIMEAYLRHDGTWWRGSVSLMSEYVTHWMPLPEPPKKVTGDG